MASLHISCSFNIRRFLDLLASRFLILFWRLDDPLRLVGVSFDTADRGVKLTEGDTPRRKHGLSYRSCEPAEHLDGSLDSFRDLLVQALEKGIRGTPSRSFNVCMLKVRL